MKDERFRKALGAELRRLRLSKTPYLSRPKLARQAGIHRNSLQRYESGLRDIPYFTLSRISKCLGTSATGLLKYVEEAIHSKDTLKGPTTHNEEISAA